LTQDSSAYSITCEDNPDPKLVDFIGENLSRDAGIKAGMAKNFIRIAVTARDADGAVVGGLVGEIAWEWIYIARIWMGESYQRRGIGTELLASAEHRAMELGCRNAYLETFSFQARPLYEKLGYEVYGVLENMPPGHRRYLMKKRLL
jgi:ribosomal protein S18 acetylase RimI-like enzyme